MTVDVTTKPRTLESYVGGEWVNGNGQGQTLLDAATGAPVARIDSSGVDFAGALAWGRDVVGPKLRKLSFHERAAMLKALGQFLMANKEEFYAESFATGATRADGWIDIEGGAGTLLSYASKARRELPNTRVLTDGDVELLSKDATFSAQHILTPLEGVAIHINAFNFPVWGMLEKVAPTFIAGVPSIVKPASQTAYLTELVVRRIVECGILPEGAIQLIAGSTGDLLDHVTGQDVVTFTGSAWTGRKLRSQRGDRRELHPLHHGGRQPQRRDPRPRRRPGHAGVRPLRQGGRPRDDGEGGPEVHRHPPGHRAARLHRRARRRPRRPPRQDRRSATRSNEATRMGPLASLDQRREVRERIRELRAEAEIVAGNPDEVRVASGDAEKGAFLNPVVLYADNPLAKTRHPRRRGLRPGLDRHALRRPRRGDRARQARQGLASSPRSSPTTRRVAEEVVLGLAPFHGRVLIGNRAERQDLHRPRLAAAGARPRRPRPRRRRRGAGRHPRREALHAAHRGPGRPAPALGRHRPLDRGRRHPGGRRPPVPQVAGGAEDRRPARHRDAQVTLEDIEHFAGFTGDTFYAHMDEAAAKANPFFDGRVAHGYLIVSFAAGLFVDPAPGPVLANYGVDNLRFLTPVYPGDTLGVRLTCKEINPRSGAEHGEVRWDCQVTNQKGEPVAQYDVLTMVAKTWPPAA